MSLKNVSLDPFLLAQLYKTDLIQTKKYVSTAETQDIPYLGNNGQNITIIIYNQEQTGLPDEQFTFLTKILEACHLSMDDVAIVNKANLPELALSELVEQLLPEKLVLLGDFFKDWGNKVLEKNKIGDIAGRPCLFSDSLKELHKDTQLKRTFWQALQTFFNLKK